VAAHKTKIQQQFLLSNGFYRRNPPS